MRRSVFIRSLCLLLNILFFSKIIAQTIVSKTATANSFSLANAVIYVDNNDETLVKKAAAYLQHDIKAVTGIECRIINTIEKPYSTIIAIGTIGRSSFIKELISKKKINTKNIAGKWEAFQIQSVDAGETFMPMQNILVITGSDRRGTAYGVFELCKQAGVSPWYWWADVPIQKSTALYIRQSVTIIDSPQVKYRGIFINDEAPALKGWATEKFGGFNHLFYEKVFELMLRLKANYLWPAMWGNAFYDDDSLNIKAADEYGIVIGTSHHEPLMRAHDEWRRYGKGKWNYDSNAVQLREFWKQGMLRATTEKIVSIGMRGDGDEPMTRETATVLLERIVADQRTIIEQTTHKPAAETPQLWALYKEVQDYYDKGMRVPDDVTLLLCDDNWGNIRKLPRLNEKPRKGGYGIYYHFDYVGGPRNYKWINTNNIARVWEQMHLAYDYKADKIWIVNVGDIKPMELPISFFLDYAWKPSKWTAANINTYAMQWAKDQFGKEHAADIGYILNRYTQFNARRKPELLSPDTYSLTNYSEAEKVVKEYNELLARAEKINAALPVEYQTAFFELVLHPVKASANLNELYFTVANNRVAYENKWAIANEYADKAKQLFINDSLISLQYHQLQNGKWNHMMDQTHIGYTNWQQPAVQQMPEVNYVPANAIVEQGPIYDTTVNSAQYLIPKNSKGNIFYEFDGWACMNAASYTNAVNTNGIRWQTIKGIGRDGDGVTPFPVTAGTQLISATSTHLEYEVYTYSKGKLNLQLYCSPTLNFHNTATGLQYAMSIDNEKPQVFSLNKEDGNTNVWEKWVADNIIIKTSVHNIQKPGRHTIKVWMIDPGIVLQKLVIDFGGLRQSYLGPPETKN